MAPGPQVSSLSNYGTKGHNRGSDEAEEKVPDRARVSGHFDKLTTHGISQPGSIHAYFNRVTDRCYQPQKKAMVQAATGDFLSFVDHVTEF